MLKKIIIVSLLLSGCSEKKYDPEVNKVAETIKTMENYARTLPFTKDNYYDAWGSPIGYCYEVESQEPWNDVDNPKYQDVMNRFAKTLLPAKAKNVKILGNDWVRFDVSGEVHTVKIELPKLHREKVKAIILSSKYPGGKIKHRVDRSFVFLRGYVYDHGKSVGSVFLTEDGDDKH